MADKAKLEKAYHWLENAIEYEAEGKSKKLVDMALNRACKLEDEAFAK